MVRDEPYGCREEAFQPFTPASSCLFFRDTTVGEFPLLTDSFGKFEGIRYHAVRQPRSLAFNLEFKKYNKKQGVFSLSSI